MISGKEYDDKLRKITKHFGVETELMKLSEELGELQNECYKRLYVDPEAGNIEDEFADVLVVLYTPQEPAYNLSAIINLIKYWPFTP